MSNPLPIAINAPTRILTPEAREDREFFEAMHGDGGCVCFLGHPPCGYCTHPGNPANQEEDDAAWMPETPKLEAGKPELAEIFGIEFDEADTSK